MSSRNQVEAHPKMGQPKRLRNWLQLTSRFGFTCSLAASVSSLCKTCRDQIITSALSQREKSKRSKSSSEATITAMASAATSPFTII